MSIDVTALDLTPPFIALQTSHVVQSLLEYPVSLVVLYVLYSAVSTRLPWVRAGLEGMLKRFGRLAFLVANGLIITPSF